MSSEKKSDKVFLKKILHGITEITEDENGAFRLFRVPRSLLSNLGERVNIRCFHPAGSELRFRMGHSPVHFTIRRMPEPNHPLFNAQTAVLIGIFHGDFQYAWLALQEGDNEIEIKPFHDPSSILLHNRSRFSPKLTRIVLPPFVELRIVNWKGEMEPPQPDDCPSKQLLSYGSSITQGAYAQHGNATYPAILARELGVDVCNLGFGGGATLEPEIAEWIVSRTDWHLATLEMGINIFNLTTDEFQTRVKNFLAIFASDPLKRPVFSLDMLPFAGEFGNSQEIKEKAAAFRRVVREETIATGKKFMSILEYASLLQRASDYSTDLLHPAFYAFESIGNALAAQIRNRNLAIFEK